MIDDPNARLEISVRGPVTGDRHQDRRDQVKLTAHTVLGRNPDTGGDDGRVHPKRLTVTKTVEEPEDQVDWRIAVADALRELADWIDHDGNVEGGLDVLAFDMLPVDGELVLPVIRDAPYGRSIFATPLSKR